MKQNDEDKKIQFTYELTEIISDFALKNDLSYGLITGSLVICICSTIAASEDYLDNFDFLIKQITEIKNEVIRMKKDEKGRNNELL